MTPIVLLILDGWGYRNDPESNAIEAANPEHFNSYWKEYPHTLIPASGEAVGLPAGIIGTSEIGHMIMGAGRVIYTDMLKINKTVANHDLGKNIVLTELFSQSIKHNSTLHLIGLLSPGGVHSHQEHLFEILREAKKAHVPQVAIHVICDGRDVPPKSAVTYIRELEKVLSEVGNAKIVTISGRYYAMDRDRNMDRTEKEVQALFDGVGKSYTGKSAEEVIEDQYSSGKTDEFIEPCVLQDDSGKPTTIQENDAVLFFNFRPDRARQLSERVIEQQAKRHLTFVTMTQYDKAFATPVLFPPEVPQTTISEEVSRAGLKQIHIAETEKYAHVTYFLNGGNETKHPNEEFLLIESRKDVPTHDKAPEMKAKEIADATVQKINEGFDFIAVNLANADMVGHTGIMEAAVTAVKAEDAAIGQIVNAVVEKNGVVLITADHGNAELMFNNETGQPHTAHTLNPVPVIITKKDLNLREGGTMADIAPTVLKLLDIPKPETMTGESLF